MIEFNNIGMLPTINNMMCQLKKLGFNKAKVYCCSPLFCMMIAVDKPFNSFNVDRIQELRPAGIIFKYRTLSRLEKIFTRKIK